MGGRSVSREFSKKEKSNMDGSSFDSSSLYFILAKMFFPILCAENRNPIFFHSSNYSVEENNMKACGVKNVTKLQMFSFMLPWFYFPNVAFFCLIISNDFAVMLGMRGQNKRWKLWSPVRCLILFMVRREATWLA